MRAYAAIGPLRIDVAQDESTARAYLDRLIVLHDRRWEQRRDGSAFTTPYCLQFHDRMLTLAMPRGEVQLVRVMAGEQELGYLYSFVHEGRVCFYQSGYNYQLLDSKFSPGLVTLVLAIQHNAAQGRDVFDFLAGNQAYKASLATDRVAMVSWTIQRRSLLATTERALRWKLGLARRTWARLFSTGKRKVVRIVATGIAFAALAAGGCYDFELGDSETQRRFAGLRYAS